MGGGRRRAASAAAAAAAASCAPASHSGHVNRRGVDCASKIQGLTFVHLSDQRKHILWDTLGA